eukprot:gb/GFBE01029349.1/.p1 GENE.gb/GFBE01029349.1/~~gb/GFBE01029349.1/.p1  ORF type:complete len:184 (+),score=32.57 gb/GFBE01029349.1/:1-552(+)
MFCGMQPRSRLLCLAVVQLGLALRNVDQDSLSSGASADGCGGLWHRRFWDKETGHFFNVNGVGIFCCLEDGSDCSPAVEELKPSTHLPAIDKALCETWDVKDFVKTGHTWMTTDSDDDYEEVILENADSRGCPQPLEDNALDTVDILTLKSSGHEKYKGYCWRHGHGLVTTKHRFCKLNLEVL